MTPLIVAAVAVAYFLAGIAVATWIILYLDAGESDSVKIATAILFNPFILAVAAVFMVIKVPFWFARRIRMRRKAD